MNRSSTKRFQDEAGQDIATLHDEASNQEVQVIALVDENVEQAGTVSNPLHVQDEGLAAIQSAIQAQGTSTSPFTVQDAGLDALKDAVEAQGTVESPLHVDDGHAQNLADIKAAVEALGTVARVLQVQVNNLPNVTVGNKPDVSIPDGVNVNNVLTTIISELDLLTRLLLNSPFARTGITANSELKVNFVNTVSSADITSVSTTNGGGNGPRGTPPAIATTAYLPVWVGPVDPRFAIIQQSNIEYANAQRSKFSFA